MYQDWGLDKLFEQLDHEMQEELTHVDALIKRILLLEEIPHSTNRPTVGHKKRTHYYT